MPRAGRDEVERLDFSRPASELETSHGVTLDLNDVADVLAARNRTAATSLPTFGQAPDSGKDTGDTASSDRPLSNRPLSSRMPGTPAPTASGFDPRAPERGAGNPLATAPIGAASPRPGAAQGIVETTPGASGGVGARTTERTQDGFAKGPRPGSGQSRFGDGVLSPEESAFGPEKKPRAIIGRNLNAGQDGTSRPPGSGVSTKGTEDLTSPSASGRRPSSQTRSDLATPEVLEPALLSLPERLSDEERREAAKLIQSLDKGEKNISALSVRQRALLIARIAEEKRATISKTNKRFLRILVSDWRRNIHPEWDASERQKSSARAKTIAKHIRSDARLGAPFRNWRTAGLGARSVAMQIFARATGEALGLKGASTPVLMFLNNAGFRKRFPNTHPDTPAISLPPIPLKGAKVNPTIVVNRKWLRGQKTFRRAAWLIAHEVVHKHQERMIVDYLNGRLASDSPEHSQAMMFTAFSSPSLFRILGYRHTYEWSPKEGHTSRTAEQLISDLLVALRDQ